MPYDAYEPVIGLEVHVQLDTESKIFSPDSTSFGAEPNTHVDPISLGHPGTLPVLNEKVVEYALRLGVATSCSISPRSVFARKHYFYPDLPKGYQISQYDAPICYDGFVEITEEDGDDTNGAPDLSKKRIGLTRIHMEEDAGKSIHDARSGASLLDYNRCGVPLLEIVTEPDLRSPNDAYRFLEKLRQLVRYLGVSDGNMEEGSLRCDANVSVRPKGREEFGTRTELKNMNSFRNVERAIEYEIDRQIELIESGGKVVQQTLLWDSDQMQTRIMRTKEEAHDYRYFPEPDIPPVVVTDEMLDDIKAELPEMPDVRKKRFVEEFGMSGENAQTLTEDRYLADFYENVVSHVDGSTSHAQRPQYFDWRIPDFGGAFGRTCGIARK